MNNEFEATLKRLEADCRRQEVSLNSLESRIIIIHDGLGRALEGMSRLKLQLENMKSRAQSHHAVLDEIRASVDRIEAALVGGGVAQTRTGRSDGGQRGRDKSRPSES